MKKPTLVKQIAQLSVLTTVHFLIDSFGGIPPVLLPEIRSRFGLSLVQGIFILTVLNITCNMVQVFTGHMRSEKRKPLFIQMGLLLSSTICLIAFVPEASAFYLLCVVFLVAGCGIAIAHPEGLRAIHTITDIPSPVTTAVFMTGGFLGFSSGGFLAAQVVTRFGIEKLIFGIAVAMGMVIVVYLIGVRLAVDADHEANKNTKDSPEACEQFHFLPLLIMSLPTTIASTVLVSMLPSRLEELGFGLRFGGSSVLLFGIGSAVGALFWAMVAHRKGMMKTAVVVLLMGVPPLVAYQFMMANSNACWFLLGAGFMSGSAFSLMVTLCRHAIGFKLGQRMGYVVGGSWGFASIVLLALSKPAEIFGIHTVLWIVPAGYAASGVIGLCLLIMRDNDRKRIAYAQD